MKLLYFIYFIIGSTIATVIPQLLLTKIAGDYVQVYSNHYIK